jgi:hypothetical protein
MRLVRASLLLGIFGGSIWIDWQAISALVRLIKWMLAN